MPNMEELVSRNSERLRMDRQMRSGIHSSTWTARMAIYYYPETPETCDCLPYPVGILPVVTVSQNGFTG